MTPVRDDINMVNTVGRNYNFTRSHVLITLGVGWAAFGLALIFNILYYALHPSQVLLHFKLFFPDDLTLGQRDEFPREACREGLWS